MIKKKLWIIIIIIIFVIIMNYEYALINLHWKMYYQINKSIIS